MRLSRRQIRRVIKEERRKILNEMWGDSVETGSPLIEFAQAYSGLGDAVQQQVEAVVAAYINGGGPKSQQFAETVYDQNPNAIDMAMDRIGRVLRYGDLGEEGEQVFHALESAQEIYMQGEEEVEADARAAGDL